MAEAYFASNDGGVPLSDLFPIESVVGKEAELWIDTTSGVVPVPLESVDRDLTESDSDPEDVAKSRQKARRPASRKRGASAVAPLSPTDGTSAVTAAAPASVNVQGVSTTKKRQPKKQKVDVQPDSMIVDPNDVNGLRRISLEFSLAPLTDIKLSNLSKQLKHLNRLVGVINHINRALAEKRFTSGDLDQAVETAVELADLGMTLAHRHAVQVHLIRKKFEQSTKKMNWTFKFNGTEKRVTTGPNNEMVKALAVGLRLSDLVAHDLQLDEWDGNTTSLDDKRMLSLIVSIGLSEIELKHPPDDGPNTDINRLFAIYDGIYSSLDQHARRNAASTRDTTSAKRPPHSWTRLLITSSMWHRIIESIENHYDRLRVTMASVLGGTGSSDSQAISFRGGARLVQFNDSIEGRRFLRGLTFWSQMEDDLKSGFIVIGSDRRVVSPPALPAQWSRVDFANWLMLSIFRWKGYEARKQANDDNWKLFPVMDSTAMERLISEWKQTVVRHLGLTLTIPTKRSKSGKNETPEDLEASIAALTLMFVSMHIHIKQTRNRVKDG